LACAAVAAASKLLVAAHAAVGAPQQEVDPTEGPLRRAVAQARTAAGAMSVVAGRLLTQVREDEARLLPDLPPPVLPETGVTAPSLAEAMNTRYTMHALQAAHAECRAATASLSRGEAPDDLTRWMAELVRIADLMVAEYVDPNR
jgi:hypothetical protein